MLLNTKIQHGNFEPGEFIDIKLRTYQETIGCINNFPWSTEREHLRVSLTNPSVTIEKPIDTFLKFALFYNGKFVLHFFNEEHELYTKSFYQKEDAFPYIKNYFESEVFDLSDFKKENTILQHNLIHFLTQDFHYTITGKRVKDYLVNTTGILFAIFLILPCVMIFGPGGGLSPVGLAALLLFYFAFFGGGLNLLCFGITTDMRKIRFSLCPGAMTVFILETCSIRRFMTKKDISRVLFYRPGSYRNPLSSFVVVKIEMKNGQVIKIPNLLVSEYALQDKLYECPQVQKGGLKLIRNNG